MECGRTQALLRDAEAFALWPSVLAIGTADVREPYLAVGVVARPR